MINICKQKLSDKYISTYIPSDNAIFCNVMPVVIQYVLADC